MFHTYGLPLVLLGYACIRSIISIDVTSYPVHFCKGSPCPWSRYLHFTCYSNNIFSLSLPLELSLVRVDSGGSVSSSGQCGLRPVLDISQLSSLPLFC